MYIYIEIKSKIMKKYFVLLIIIFSFPTVHAQNFVTRTAHINIKSANKVQDIVADNYQVACQLNTQTGEIKIIGLIKSFEYQIGAVNRVMNTRDIDVTDYPKITFEGKIVNLRQINFSKQGSYPVVFNGVFYIWDEKSTQNVSGTLIVKKDNIIEFISNFTIAVEKIDTEKIDMIMRQKLPVSLNLQPNVLGISKNIQIKANAIMKKQ
jgi:hypothetical protein